MSFKPRCWRPDMSLEETKNLAYWERNMLALRYADGWYNDDVPCGYSDDPTKEDDGKWCMPRFDGWRRVLSLEGGRMTFHIPDDFDVGKLPQIEPNWDGHTTEEKWLSVACYAGIIAHEDLPEGARFRTP